MSQLYTKRSHLPFKISPVTAEDLRGIAEGQVAAFDYLELEPLAIRAPYEDRCRRGISRYGRIFDQPGQRPMKAVVTQEDGTERLAALAYWHAPGCAIDNLQKRNVEKMDQETDEERDSWEAFDWEKWNNMLEKYDVMRKKKMGDEPHWYVGPVWTHPDFQGQGIATALLEETIAIADSRDPPVPMYLEASKAGQPVYAKLGWEKIEGTETAMLRRGPRKTAEQ